MQASQTLQQTLSQQHLSRGINQASQLHPRHLYENPTTIMTVLEISQRLASLTDTHKEVLTHPPITLETCQLQYRTMS